MDVSGHDHTAATVAVGGLAAGGHERQRALGDHVAGFAGDHTPAAVAVGVLAVGDMYGSGRPEPMSLPESMSTPLLLLLRSASSRSGMDELYQSPRSCRQFDEGNVLAMPAPGCRRTCARRILALGRLFLKEAVPRKSSVDPTTLEDPEEGPMLEENSQLEKYS
ncbi:hypothetical protein PR003_g30607 [Phytophthora rubi]|uniref:Uncharacterized protein n=1 Tax=Phytophthora rubi TaxID=129364 RepID=A0A6A4BEJ9_9STRA|nr:hypothetical protein PR003_g30607 [Phytophthora rubi]